MARLPRLCLPGHLHLLLQTAQPGHPVFGVSADCVAYLDALREAAATHRVAVHAYALLPGEALLLVTPTEAQAMGRMVQAVGRRFAAASNLRHGRSGSLWQRRFSATVVDAQAHFLDCLRFVEAAPVRARLVAHAADYPWSSAAHHAGRNLASLIQEHPGYWALGNTPFEREAKHGLLMEQALTLEETAMIEKSASHGWVLGVPAFAKQLAAETVRRLRPLPRGRPPKSKAPAGSVR
jgi:putative transposase